jgi:hypothetical protein
MALAGFSGKESCGRKDMRHMLLWMFVAHSHAALR